MEGFLFVRSTFDRETLINLVDGWILIDSLQNLMEDFHPFLKNFMEGFLSILYKFGDGIYTIPHELTEGFLSEISLHLIPVFSI